MSKKKLSTANIVSKEEVICPNKIIVKTDRILCETTGSAAILSVLADEREINIHLTTAEVTKLYQNLSKLSTIRNF